MMYNVRYDRTHEKSGNEDYIIPSHRVHFPRFGESSLRYRDTLFLKTNQQVEMDIKRLATRFGSIDEQWILRTGIHILATIPLHDFNDVWESYIAIQKRRAIQETQERRANYPLGAIGRIMNAGGLDWLIWSKSQGRSMKKTAEVVDVAPSTITYFLNSRYNTNWTDLGD